MLLALLSQCKSNLCGMPIKQQVYHTCTRCRLLSHFLNKVFFVRFKSISIPFGEHVCMFFCVQYRRVHVLSVLSIYAEGWSWKFPWILCLLRWTVPCDGELFEVQCMVSRTPDDEYDFLTLNHNEEKISYNDGNTTHKKFLLCFIEYPRQCICCRV